MNKVVVKSKYNPKYHFKFYTYHLFRKSSSIYIFLVAGLLSLYLAINATMGEEATSQSITIAWSFVVLIFISIPLFTFTKIKTIVKKTTKERQDSLEIMEFTKFKITRILENEEGKAVLGWEHFESIVEFRDFYLMYIDKDRGLVLAKADIIEGSPEAFEKMARANLKPNKKGKIKYKVNYKEK